MPPVTQSKESLNMREKRLRVNKKNISGGKKALGTKCIIKVSPQNVDVAFLCT